jgi:hypothetical protein
MARATQSIPEAPLEAQQLLQARAAQRRPSRHCRACPSRRSAQGRRQQNVMTERQCAWRETRTERHHCACHNTPTSSVPRMKRPFARFGEHAERRRPSFGPTRIDTLKPVAAHAITGVISVGDAGGHRPACSLGVVTRTEDACSLWHAEMWSLCETSPASSQVPVGVELDAAATRCRLPGLNAPVASRRRVACNDRAISTRV